jgi:hypothetical protein
MSDDAQESGHWRPLQLNDSVSLAAWPQPIQDRAAQALSPNWAMDRYSAYTLAPNASAFLTQTAVISRPTVNTATWTAFNPGPVDVAVASDTASVWMPSVYLPIAFGQ